MDTNKIASLIRVERDRHEGHPDGIDRAIHFALDRMSETFADYFESEYKDWHKFSRPHDCSAHCYFNRAEWFRNVKGTPEVY